MMPEDVRRSKEPGSEAAGRREQLMNGAGEMIVIDTKFPDPDSHFRLRPCGCSSENVGYLQIRADCQKLWAIHCFVCGKTSDMFLVRHDAQINWNTNGTSIWRRRRKRRYVHE